MCSPSPVFMSVADPYGAEGPVPPPNPLFFSSVKTNFRAARFNIPRTVFLLCILPPFAASLYNNTLLSSL